MMRAARIVLMQPEYPVVPLTALEIAAQSQRRGVQDRLDRAYNDMRRRRATAQRAAPDAGAAVVRVARPAGLGAGQ